MANLTLGLLGSLQVMVANTPITTFESDKARALLAYLAVESQQPHRRESLIGLLWPDCPEEGARRNLRQTLYNLRQAIGDHRARPPYLLITREEIQFNTASDHALDVATFKAQLAASAAHPHAQLERCAPCAAHLQQAIDLYRGRFLQEFFLQDSAEFEEWALVQRESLHRRALEALVHLANYHEQRAEYEAARGYALRQLELDSWREEAHRQVMRLLAANGQRSEALAQYETCRRVLANELGIEPSAETRKLYEQIRQGEVSLRRSEPLSTIAWAPPALPVSLTPFIGRERELAELEQLLGDSECRLATLVGPGGIGKTRLALQVAADRRESRAQGAAFVALASVDSPTFIVSAIGDAVGLAFYGPTDPKLQLLNYLREKQMLLVLDNVEHLLDGAGLFVEILEHAPEVKLLVTSREQLNLQGEWVFEVGGLHVPASDQAETFEQSSAVALFLQRARRAHAGFTLQANQRWSVGRICRLVDGMPLAIELAAAWVRTLSLDEIEREIERNLDFLSTSMRDLPERHRSMRAVFDHSWRLLSADEQAVLARLSIFRGGFQREAAEQIAGATLALLSTLQAKSFLRRMPGGRYDLHELVRQYAAERLHENLEEEAATRNHHSAYYTDFAAAQEKHLKGARQIEALAEISTEMENIRIAWRHAVTHYHIDSVRKPIRAFQSLFEMRGWNAEGQALYSWAAAELQTRCDVQVQAETSFKILLAQIQSAQGWCSVTQGRLEEARQLLEPSTATLRSLGAKVELVHALHHLGVLDWQTGAYVRARAAFLEELDLATQLEDRWEMALACGNVAMAAQMLGEHLEALERYQAALAAYRSLEDRRMVAADLSYLGELECKLGMCAASRASLHESVELSRMIGDRWVLGMALSALGTVTQGEGDIREAVALFQESLALFDQTGERWSTIDTLNRLGSVMLALDSDAEAEGTFLKALNLAREIRLLPGQLEALVGIAQWQMKKGQPESALAVLTGVLKEPSLAIALRDRAEHLRMEVERQLTPEQIETADAQARNRTIEAIIQEVLGLYDSQNLVVPLSKAVP